MCKAFTPLRKDQFRSKKMSLKTESFSNFEYILCVVLFPVSVYTVAMESHKR